MLSPQSVHVDGPMTSMSESMTNRKRKRKRRGNHAKMSGYSFNELVAAGEEVIRLAGTGLKGLYNHPGMVEGAIKNITKHGVNPIKATRGISAVGKGKIFNAVKGHGFSPDITNAVHKQIKSLKSNHFMASEYTFNELVAIGEQVYKMSMYGVVEHPETKDKANMSAYGRSVLKDPLKKPIPKKPLPPGTRKRIK